MKDPPPPAEICKRRRLELAPIITKCFDETMDSSKYISQVTQGRIITPHDAFYDKDQKATNGGDQEISRWSSTSEDSRREYSDCDIESEMDKESYYQKLGRYRHFFDNRPLMRCLDTDDDQLLAE
jgi:hypothetical protein